MKLSEMAAAYAANQATSRTQEAATTQAAVSPDEMAQAVNTLAQSMRALFDGLSRIKELKK